MKKKLIQLITLCLTVVLCLSFQFNQVCAASFSVSANKSSVNPGQSFTVTVSVSGAGQFSVSASNGSVSASSIWVDGSSSFTVIAGSSGKTTVSVTAVDVTSYEEEAITGTHSVSVTISAPTTSTKPTTPTTPSNSNTTTNNNNTSTTEPTQEVDTRSSNNLLSSLTISSGSLSPDFSEKTTSYTVELTSDVTSISIDAKAKDSKATVSGTGKHSLVIGHQTFGITVTAENGTKKVYSISVHVTEKPTVFTKLGDQELGLLINVSDAKIPDGYKSQTIKLEGLDITGWSSEKTGLTLVYLMNKDGQKNLYIYENGKIVRQYETVEINGKTYVLLDIDEDMKKQSDLVFGKVKLGDLEVEGWTFVDENHKDYCVVYLLNPQGEKVLYTYEQSEGTLQKYASFEKVTPDSTLTSIFMGTTGLFVVSTLTLAIMYLRFKKKSIASIKEYYERKNKSLGN